ncbi:somatostatin receptor type 2-like [Diadema antillarum]|uniref:somatostatin receptor type 2-like n=1 Tax=Diadema antillarum TaxID=105358 RepID=UPI003A891B09
MTTASELQYMEENETNFSALDADYADVYVDVGFELPFLYAVCLFGLFGNTLVCMVYTKHKHRRSNAALYILNLAAADITALIVVLFHITEFYPSTWTMLWAYNIQCQIHRCARFVGFNCTVFTMMAIAVDRFFAVKDPVAFKSRFTRRRTKLIIVFIWASAIVAAIPVAFMFESIYGGDGVAVTYTGKLPWACKAIVPFGPWWKDFKPVYLNILLFYVPVIITSIIYVFIFTRVRSSNKFLRSNLVISGRIPEHARNTHWKTAKTLLCVFVVFIVCFAPFATYHIVQEYFSGSLHPELKNLALLLPYFNSCLNPIVYSFTNKVFWRAVKQILCRCERCREPDKPSFSSCDAHVEGRIQLAVSEHVLANNIHTQDIGLNFIFDSRNTSEIALNQLGKDDSDTTKVNGVHKK